MQFDPDSLAEAPRAPLRKVARLFRPHHGLIAAALLCVGIGSALGLVPPLLVKEVIDQALPHGDSGLLKLLVLGMLGALVASGLTAAREPGWHAGPRGWGVLETLLWRCGGR